MNYLEAAINLFRELYAFPFNIIEYKPLTPADLIQIGILFAAFLAILVPHIFLSMSVRNEKSALKGALLQEMLANIDSLFNGGIERPFLYINFEKFVSKLSSKIEDESEFQRIMWLYIELKDYRAITDRYWPPSRSGYDADQMTIDVTTKQLKTINSFLDYFGEDSVELFADTLGKTKGQVIKSLEGSRRKARNLRNIEQEKWHLLLATNINKII